MDRLRKALLELGIVLLGGVVVFLVAGRFDLYEKLADWAARHEAWEIDEFMSLSLYLVVAFIVILIRRYINLKEHLEEIGRKNLELQEAAAKIRVLEKIITVCSYCRKVRGEKEEWMELDQYIHRYTDSRFSHGICPACIIRHHPELEAELNARDGRSHRQMSP